MVKQSNLVLIGLVSLLAACSAAPESESETDDIEVTSQAVRASGKRNHKNPKYLALGDSVPFGYSPLLPWGAPWTQFVGYPEEASDDLRWGLTNAACPGETTASLLSASAVPQSSCLNTGMKADYTEYGATTQIEYATAYLKDHRATKLVTLNIGGNDIQLPFYVCGVTSPANIPPSAWPCIQAQLPIMFATYQQNLDTILGKIRASGYKKDLVLVNQYAIHYAHPALTPLFAQLNTIAAGVAAKHKATVSDSFGAFQKASASFGGDPCAAGLLIPLPGGGCDLHPTPKGAKLLAKTLVKTVDSCDHDD